MRKFYIFKINKELAILTRDCTYNIYKNMEQIKKYNARELDFCYNIYDQLIECIPKESYNKVLFKKYKENVYYQKNHNTHYINNKYRPEETTLTINNSYILLETNYLKPSFLNDLSYDKNLFVCDFDNRDYFWIEQLQI